MSSSDFGGEGFLQVKLPDYGKERLLLTILLWLAAIAWIVVLPLWFGVEREILKEDKIKPSNGQHRKKKKIIKSAVEPGKRQVVVKEKEVPTFVSALSCIGLILSFVILLLTMSPHNYYTARTVFQMPLLTVEECERIVSMASAAATKNYEQAVSKMQDAINEKENATRAALLEEPVGWQKTRHESYPTTDLNLVTDPFTKEDRAWIGNLLDRRLAPALSRIYGIPVNSIRANDMFVVRYDADKRAHLINHVDDGDISFNVLLNDGFEGGGTLFWNRIRQEPFAHVQPSSPGTLLAHSALINHEGSTVTAGTRLIFVGFLSVDRIDPFTEQPTGLSKYASWLSLSWMHTKFKEGYVISMEKRLDPTKVASAAAAQQQEAWWRDSLYVRMLFLDLVRVLQFAGDFFSPHRVLELVNDHHDRSAYLQALDDAEHDPSAPAASWFQGQMLNVDVDGTIASTWSTREEHADAFQEL